MFCKNKTVMKKGDIYYKAELIIESAIQEKCYVELEEWHVTKVNSGMIYLTQKLDKVTWGKLSAKNGDFGFLPNVNAQWYKDSVVNDIDKIIVRERLVSKGYFKTKISAFRSIKKHLDKKVNELLRLQRKVNKSIK